MKVYSSPVKSKKEIAQSQERLSTQPHTVSKAKQLRFETESDTDFERDDHAYIDLNIFNVVRESNLLGTAEKAKPHVFDFTVNGSEELRAYLLTIAGSEQSIELLKHRLAVNNEMNLQEVFDKYFDKTHKRYLTVEDFMKALALVGLNKDLLTADNAELVLQRFSSMKNLADYRKYQRYDHFQLIMTYNEYCKMIVSVLPRFSAILGKTKSSGKNTSHTKSSAELVRGISKLLSKENVLTGLEKDLKMYFEGLIEALLLVLNKKLELQKLVNENKINFRQTLNELFEIKVYNDERCISLNQLSLFVDQDPKTGK